MVNPPEGMCWGKYNKHDINKRESRKLWASMEVTGLNNSDLEIVIHIGIRKEWLQGKLTGDKAIHFLGNHCCNVLTDNQKTSEKHVKNLHDKMST